MTIAAHGQIVFSQRRLSRSKQRKISTDGNQSSMEYLARKPMPQIAPAASHAQLRRSRIALAARHVVSAQQKKNGASIVISVPPAMYIGTIGQSKNAPSASRSLLNSFRV